MDNNQILLTGATGALGSEILRRLLGEGREVTCLVRAKDRAHAQHRIQDIVGQNPRVHVIRGDITEPRCGISDIDREHLVNNVDRIFHCAASILFGDKDATMKANVDGVRNMLELADILNVWQIVHVSTAYVAGEADRFDETQLASSIRQRPRNSYEETKQIGETMVRSWALQRDDRRLSILRPSILIGCADGTSPTFDAYYGYFKPIHHVAQALRQRAKDGKSLPPDVTVDGEYITVPLVLRASEESTLNVVPIDWSADVMVKILHAPPQKNSYHVVNPNPPQVTWVIDTSLSHLKIRGVKIAHSAKEKNELMGTQSPFVAKLQRQVDRVLDQFEPYTCHSTNLSMDMTETALRGNMPPMPSIDVAFLGRLLAYALRTEWGTKLPAYA